jgi:hydroxyacylglutathione hydrolase
MIDIHAIPAFSDNYIWLIRFGDRQAAVVDPGEAEAVLRTLREQNLTLAAILITHHHWDHVGGIEVLRGHFPVPVYGPASEQIPQLSHPCRDGDRIDLDDLHLAVMEVPGHTASHIAYYGHDALFCGDTLFAAGCGRLFGGTAAQLYDSLNKISQLPINTYVYCAHEYTLANLKFARAVEPENSDIRHREETAQVKRSQGEATVPSQLALELKTNPFLRCHVKEVITATQGFAGREPKDAAEVFKVLRYWKDSFA